MKKYIVLSIMLFQFLQIQAQNIDLESLPNVEDYIITKSNSNADTVIIGLHGGPYDNLALGEFEFFESISTFSVVELMQYQHIHSGILHDPNITLDQAVAMNDTTVAMIKKAVNHFNDLNKFVVLIGHSFGGFLLHEYLDDYGISEKTIVVSLGARLNLNQIIIDFLLLGHQFEFDEDGLTVDIDGIPSEEYKTTVTFIASLAQNRYVDSLQMTDLSKFMVVYGMYDRAVGRLLPEEIEMLENSNATTLEITGGNHNSPLYDQLSLDAIVYFIRNCELATTTQDINTSQNNKIYPTVTSDFLVVDTKSNAELIIVDLNGVIHYKKNIIYGIQEIQLPLLPDGQYIALIRTIENKWTSHKFVIIKNGN